ncbi:MFS transporter [Nocardioides ferulae]|uniref:MFS transporter n=1 Tax=Nocardioides ferulae TaxID=2340821 RepID=UPI000EB0F882|nr:MFS transporter [Nocardioides ferulae]
MTAPGRRAAGSPDPATLGWVLVALCVSVTASYGVLYYAFTVLAPAISADTGWSATQVTTAFSVGSLTGALAGIWAGRLLQRRGPRLVMTGGSLLGAVGAAGVGLAPSYPVFVAAWLLVGIASAGTFYPPAFAALTQWYGVRRVRAITVLTLVAGFASTIFAPLTAALGEGLGWRDTYLVFAGLLLAITVPAHAFALRLPWHSGDDGAHVRPDREVLTSRPFLLLAASGTLASLAMYASIVHLVPLLLALGVDLQLAAWALGLSGAGQVAGRLVYPALDRRTGPNARAAGTTALMGLTLAGLALAPGPVVLLIAIAVVSGAARGLFTLVGATIVSDHWGPQRYAALNGVFQAPMGVAGALAPAFGAGVAAATGSYAALFGVLAVLALVGAALVPLAGRPADVRAAAGRPDEHA